MENIKLYIILGSLHFEIVWSFSNQLKIISNIMKDSIMHRKNTNQISKKNMQFRITNYDFQTFNLV